MPFLGVDVDHSDSGREGATVSTLALTTDLDNWKEAVKLTLQEVGCSSVNLICTISWMVRHLSVG